MDKPEVTVLKIGGRVVVLNGTAAAAFCRVPVSTFRNAVVRAQKNMDKGGRYGDCVRRIREAYPELFEAETEAAK